MQDKVTPIRERLMDDGLSDEQAEVFIEKMCDLLRETLAVEGEVYLPGVMTVQTWMDSGGPSLQAVPEKELLEDLI